MKKLLIALLATVVLSNVYAETVTIFDSNSTVASGDSYDTLVVKGDGTVVNMTGGSITKLITMNDSTFNMSDGSCNCYSYDTSTVNISGGTISTLKGLSQSKINITGQATITQASFGSSSTCEVSSPDAFISSMCIRDVASVSIINGTISSIRIHGLDYNCKLYVRGGSVENISGGTYWGTIQLNGGTITEIDIVYDLSNYKINVVGYDLINLPYGGSEGCGQITGYWNDDSSFSINLGSPLTYDFINLYDGITPVTCTNQPGSDLSNDCHVDMDDLVIMASEWLVNETE